MAEQLEFYFPKTKSKHMATPTTGKVYPSKGGTVRYGVQASMNGSMSLPKYVKENQFYDYGFGVDSVVRKYPQEFMDTFYDFDSNPTADTQDDETVELAYQVWYQKQAENEVLNAEVNVGEKRVMSRKDYDIDNELSGFSNMEVGDIDLEDYQDEITENVEDEVIEAIRESVDDAMPISDGESISSSVNVDTELEITVPISGDIDYDWTANETHEDDRHDDEWNAEGLNFHGENYQNHLKVVKKAPYGGIGSLFGIGGDTEIGGFSTSELTGSSAIHGDFDSASLNYSGHQNLQVRAEDSPSPSSPLEDVPATVPSPAEPTNESFNAEDMNCAICGTWEAAHKMDITTGSCLRCVSKGFNAESKNDDLTWCAYCDDLITDDYYFTDGKKVHVDCNLKESFNATTGYGYDDPPERMTDEEGWLEMYDDYLEDEDSPMTLEEYKKWVIEAREKDYQMQVKFDQRLKDEGLDELGNPIGTEYGFDAENSGKMNLTMKELLVLILVNRDWNGNTWQTDGDGELSASFYHDDVDMKKMRGVLSSLVKKGIIGASEDYVNRHKYTMVSVNNKYTTGVANDGIGNINWNMFDCKDEIVANMGYENFIEWASTIPESIVRGMAESKMAETFNTENTSVTGYQCRDCNYVVSGCPSCGSDDLIDTGYNNEDYQCRDCSHVIGGCPSCGSDDTVSFDVEMDELDDSSSIIRNQVGDMVGMVELDKNDEDIEKVDIDIIDDDGEMAYEGTLGAESENNSCDTCQKDKPIVAHVEFDGPFLSALCKECYAEHLEMGGKPSVYVAETFESQGKNTKMILGITALAVGLGLWKGKEIMSISDKISESIKNMRK